MSEPYINDYNKTEKTLVDLVISQAPLVAYANGVIITFIGIAIWSSSDTSTLSMWMLCGYLIVAFRVVFFSKLRSGEILPDNYFYREALAALGLAIVGAHWGFSIWFFLDPNNQISSHNLILVSAVLGVASGTLASAAPRPKLWLAFGVSEFAIVIAKCITLDFTALAVMSVVYIIGVYLIAKQVGKRIEASVTKDFLNGELLIEVRQAKELAEKANIEKSQFMAATSHDLRQPLHAQGLLIEALKGQNLDTPEQQLIDKLSQSNQALTFLFDSLLEISQLDAETIKVNKSHQPLALICRQVINEFEQQAIEKNLSIVLEGKDHVVLSDPVLLIRIISNLISNAIKYTEKGRVTVKMTCNEDAINLSIKDTGIGIAKDQHKAIFNEYMQLNNNARDRRKGVGLGLALVRRMCDLLEHDITIESSPKKGSCFTLKLPKGDQQKIITVQETPQLNSIVSCKIVLIDDETPVLDAMQTLFKQWQCHCYAFATLQEAQTQLSDSDEDIDLIISDYRLSGDITGIECINTLREIIGPVPAILLSGDTDPELLKQVQDKGFRMLHKPLKPAILRNLISTVLAPQ